MTKKIDFSARIPRLRTSAWAVASSLLIAACPAMTQAAGLGKITVFSALGQPLRAEAEIFASREELAGMKAHLASPDAHKQAGVDYSTTLGGISFTIAKRANGQPIIRMSSDRPINDPFVDLLLELNWPAGRLVREYTFLLDPPEYAAKHAAAPGVTKPSVSVQQPAAESRPARAEVIRQRPGRPAPRTPVEGSAYEVRPGETLSKIANDTRPEGISLDQMLVAIFRANPDAFERGNMNHLKAGKILTIPDRSAIDAVPRDDARKAVTAQSADWGGYRRKLARQAAVAPVAEAAPKQQSAGKISARVEDKSSPAVEPKDQLKISKTELPGTKPAAPGKRSDEDLIAKEKALRDANERLATLEKNVAELQKLVELKTRTLAELEKQAAGKPASGVPAGKLEETRPATPSPSSVPLPSASPSAPPIATPAVPAVEPPAAPQPKPSDSLPATPPVTAKAADAESKPTEIPAKPDDKLAAGKTDEVKPVEAVKPAEAPPAAEVAQPVAKPKPKVVTVPPEEPGVFDELLSGTPLIAGGGLIAALAAAYWFAKRRRPNRGDSLLDPTSTLSPASPDSLAASSAVRSAGGQSVDTSHSMMSQADFSQAGPGSIDTDEVDPVAEADVYMAYGRDAQAEEILLEAKQKDPTRHAIHLKLLEIYLARKHDKPFNTTINELFNATAGSGPDWEKAAALGRQMEPNNPLYAAAAVESENKPAEEPVVPVAKPSLPPGRMGDTVTRPGELSRIAEAATSAVALSGFAAAATQANTNLQSKLSPADDFDDSTFDLGEATVAVTGVQNPQSTTVFSRSATVGPIDFDLATSISSAQRVPNIDFGEPPLLVEDHEVPEVTMLVAPGSVPDTPAVDNGLDFEFDLTTEFADHRHAAEPTQIESSPPADEMLDIGAPETQQDLEFDVKLTESTVLGQALQQSSFDMSSISLDLDEMDTQSPSSVTEFAGETDFQSSFENEQEDTLVNPAAGIGHLETLADQHFDSSVVLPGDNDISASEEVATKLDLAKAYHEMGDHEGARELLLEVLKDGDATQRDAASVLLASLRE